jgi:hypothetical protein
MMKNFDAFNDTQNGVDIQGLTHCFVSARALVKLNDLVDIVNTLVEENNTHEKQIDELQMKVKQIADHKIRSTNERLRLALEYAIDVIQTVAKMADKRSREYGDTLIEQIDNIQAYCWQEGYILTHKEDLEKAIKEKKEKQ